MITPHSCAVPGKKPGTSTKVTSGTLKASQVRTNLAAVVDDPLDHLLDVIRLGRVVGDDGIELGILAARRVGRLRVRRRLEVVLRQKGEEVARVVEARLLIGRD